MINKWATSWQNQQNDLCTQLRLRSAWASAQSGQSSQCAQWVAEDPMFLHVESEESDQLWWMPRLIWVFAGCKGHFVGFVMRWLKLVLFLPINLSCSFSNESLHDIFFILECRKNPKNLDTRKLYGNHSKIGTKWRYHRIMHRKDAGGIENSVDPDQTAPRSSLIWVCTFCPSLSVWKLRIITVCFIQVCFKTEKY